MAQAAKKSLALIEWRTRNFIDLYQVGGDIDEVCELTWS
jgi:hypothetical protein